MAIPPAATQDRISALPDHLLIHILSLVSTKEVFVASVLSKRWENIKFAVPLIKFTDVKLNSNELGSISKFHEFVNSVLLLRHSDPTIGKFYLHIKYSDWEFIKRRSFCYLPMWVDFLVQRNVHEIEIFLDLILEITPSMRKYLTDDKIQENRIDGERFQYQLIPKLPKSILSCRTLTVLKLRWFTLKEYVLSSIQLGFPVMKVLHLEFIEFDFDRDCALLVAACPNLEDYKAVFVYSEDKEWYMTYRKYKYMYKPIDEEFSGLRLNRLVRADLTGPIIEIPLHSFPNLQFLRILLREAYGHKPADFPIFHNLTQLVLNYDRDDMLMELLHHCPYLQKLELYLKIDRRLTHLPPQRPTMPYIDVIKPHNWVDPTAAPQCVSLHLRTCTIRDFALVDLQHDLMLAMFFLKYASVLEALAIWSEKEKPRIEREISSCPRASATCQLSIY